MNEFIKNIINDLEQVPTEYNHEEYNRAVRDVIRFIKRFKTNSDGWIPCSERLPDTSQWHPSVVAKDFLVTYYPDPVTKPWVGIRFFKKETNEFLVKKEEEVIAWQPLPEAYRPDLNERREEE